MADAETPRQKQRRSIAFYAGMALLLVIVYVFSAVPIYWVGRNRVPNRVLNYFNYFYAPLNWTLINSPETVQDAYRAWTELWLGDPMKAARPKPKPRPAKPATQE